MAAVFLAVNHEPRAFFFTSFAQGQFFGFGKKLSQQNRIGFQDGGDMLFGDHQEMKGGLGMYVVKGQEFIIFVEFFAGNFSGDNFTKNTVHGFIVRFAGIFARARVASMLNLTLTRRVLSGYSIQAPRGTVPYIHQTDYIKRRLVMIRHVMRALCLLAAALSCAGTESLGAEVPGASYIPGEYSGKGRGRQGDIVVRIRVDEQRILEIEVLDHDEDPFTGVPALESLAETALEENSADLDTVSGATLSSRGFLEAVEDALDQARPVP